MEPRASVIVSTYNSPGLLDLTLHGYARQSIRGYEIVIADDGSGPETRELIESHAARLPVPLVHVWQPDEGFLKARAVNRAILRSAAPYVVFTDGDCIPSRTFVEEHIAAAREDTYTIGGHIRLDAEETAALTAEDVESGRFERAATFPRRLELWNTHLKSLFYIAIRKRRKPRLLGLNFAVSRAVLERVNGFDQTYAGVSREDSDIRNRMQVAGVAARSLWHRALVFHQYHGAHATRSPARDSPLAAHYNRPDLGAEAPIGLRELRAELAAEERAAPADAPTAPAG